MTLQDREPDVEKLLAFARDVISGAETKALSLYGKGNAAVKFDEGLVTSAELELTDFLENGSIRFSPGTQSSGHRSPEEDYVHGDKRYLWIYDPLDGVANFQAGIPIWSISLALLENFWPVFGVTFMPVTGDLFMPSWDGRPIGASRKSEFRPPAKSATKACCLPIPGSIIITIPLSPARSGTSGRRPRTLFMSPGDERRGRFWQTFPIATLPLPRSYWRLRAERFTALTEGNFI